MEMSDVFDSRLTGSTTFSSGYALNGGAIYTDDGDVEDGVAASTTTYPDDTVFVDNAAEVPRSLCSTSPLIFLFALAVARPSINRSHSTLDCKIQFSGTAQRRHVDATQRGTSTL